MFLKQKHTKNELETHKHPYRCTDMHSITVNTTAREFLILTSLKWEPLGGEETAVIIYINVNKSSSPHVWSMNGRSARSTQDRATLASLRVRGVAHCNSPGLLTN